MFLSYLLGTKVIVYSYDATLHYLMTNKEAKLRLIRWILFLIEFNVDLKDKGGTENHVADHLSHLVHVEGEIYLQETSPHKQLFFTSVILP